MKYWSYSSMWVKSVKVLLLLTMVPALYGQINLEDGGLAWRMSRGWWLGVTHVLRMVPWSDGWLEDGCLE